MVPVRAGARGAGFGFRPALKAGLFAERGAADVIEIVADHYLAASREKRDELDLLAAHWPLLPHGLDLSLGSAEGLDEAYLDRLAALIDKLNPPWWSEHIAFTRAGGVRIGHLAALPQTRQAVEVITRNVERVRRRIAAPLLLENVTVVTPLPGAEMDEPDFVSAVLEATGCGWLCDLTNLHTNAVNQGRDLDVDWPRWPWVRLVEVHLAGGRVGADGVLIDSHDRPVPPEVWRLLERAFGEADIKTVIVERDEDLPPVAELAAETARVRAVAKAAGRWR